MFLVAGVVQEVYDKTKIQEHKSKIEQTQDLETDLHVDTCICIYA